MSAIMIPERPRSFDPASQEGLMFAALEMLPEDYYVFHSFRITDVVDGIVHESETDFVIYNRKKGVLCLEAKAGHVYYSDGYWRYGDGRPMHNDGPFVQASSNKWKLIKHIESGRFSSILSHCKFLHAVWFPTLSIPELKRLSLPSEADVNLILTKEALIDPKTYIDRLFDINLPNGKQTDISENESQCFIKEVLCPEFDVFPTASFSADLKKIVFHRLLKEQANVLNYLTEQRSAVINGAAGTGKTMIAVEKAKKHVANNEKVLFLCYNSKLRDYLQENHSIEGVDYFTIAALACKWCNTSLPDYKKLNTKLIDMYVSQSFPYQHVIVDEGQDFGMEDIEESNILESLKTIIEDQHNGGTFYIFYDKLQLIQSKEIPSYIQDADCKLTLYKNCRNTKNIAQTSLRPVSERDPISYEGCVKGVPANLYYCNSRDEIIKKVDSTIAKLKGDGISDIVILTCKTEDKSILSDAINNGVYKGKIKFSTCRKFKGLEADAVILVDLDEETFNSHNVLLYYVGTSRARLRLEIVTMLSDDACTDILQNRLSVKNKIKNPKRELAGKLNAVGSIV